MGGNEITMDTGHQNHPGLLNQHISSEVFPSLDSGQRSAMGEMAMSYNPPGGVISMEGGILGSKRKDGSHEFLPGSKRRSPYNSQSDLPVWVSDEGVVPGIQTSSMPPPPPSGPASLSSRRASIGSAAQLGDRPVLQKNRSEPAGSLILKVSL